MQRLPAARNLPPVINSTAEIVWFETPIEVANAADTNESKTDGVNAYVLFSELRVFSGIFVDGDRAATRLLAVALFG